MEKLRLALRKLPDILYPRRCAICDKALFRDELYVCKKCIGDIRLISGRTCIKCGVPLKSRYEELCPECAGGKRVFDEAFAPFSYSGKMRDSIARFKYRGRAEYAGFYARCICAYGGERIKGWNAQLIVPVPIHKSRLSRRGYNQAALIAKKLEAVTGIPCDEGLVERQKKTKAQKELSPSERRNNIRSAFRLINRRYVPESIIIVDDIFTTGSTVNELSYILRSAGAKRIYVVCVSVS